MYLIKDSWHTVLVEDYTYSDDDYLLLKDPVIIISGDPTTAYHGFPYDQQDIWKYIFDHKVCIDSIEKVEYNKMWKLLYG